MASSPIHLAIAKKFLERNKNYDKGLVLSGTLYPDTIKDKDLTHYSDLRMRGLDNVSHLAGKVNLHSFLLEHSYLSSFEFGWFLHLVTDYLFFDECFTKEYLLTHTYDEFRHDLYFSYDCLCDYIVLKYGITMDDYNCYPSEYFPGRPYQDCLFTKEMIDDFILRVSSVDYEDYVRKLKLTKNNIKPWCL